MQIDAKIFVSGHNGLVGSSVVRKLKNEGYKNILLKTKEELDLTNQNSVKDFFHSEKPDYVIDCAAKVGGLKYNIECQADIIYNNLMIQNNIIHNSYLCGVKKLLFMGSVCIYPKFCEIPIKEEYLMTGKPEPTNDSYSIAKIAGIKMCQAYNKQYNCNFITLMPTNVYGPNDRFNVNQGHVIPGLICKFVQAKENNLKIVECWGDGTSTREFIFSDDLAEAAIFLMDNYNSNEMINVGTENEVTIKELANLIKEIVGYEGEIIWNTSKPNGVSRRKMCNEKIYKMGWKPKTNLKDGLVQTIEWFMNNREIIR